MKRFAAILDASLDDNEGEQGGLVAFPHRVLQPDNDMVYIYAGVHFLLDVLIS